VIETKQKIELTPDQKAVHDQILDFHKSKGETMTVGGFAGCGKTTLIAEVTRTLQNEKAEVSFCSYTGKAASVLREKLDRAEVQYGFCGTIHSLIYRPVTERGLVVGWERKDALADDQNPELIIVDEASMVNEEIWNDLKSYGIPILAVGDHGQLPPIAGTLNLMEKPDATLTKIHRQAEGNPIIRLSMLAREEGHIPLGEFGPGVRKIQTSPRLLIESQTFDKDVLFLCGYNWTRITVNKLIRTKLGRKFFPEKGDKVICLKNNRKKSLFNGMGGEVVHIFHKDKWFFEARIMMADGTPFQGNIPKQQFCAKETMRDHPELDPKELKNLFDFGYCLTVHKAQGSEADEVVLFEERFSSMTDDEWRRWLYTGVTRARTKLTIIGKPVKHKQTDLPMETVQ